MSPVTDPRADHGARSTLRFVRLFCPALRHCAAERSLPSSAARSHAAGGILRAEVLMRFEHFAFGSIRIDGTTYEHDVVIDRGEVRRRKKKPSKQFRGEFG